MNARNMLGVVGTALAAGGAHGQLAWVQTDNQSPTPRYFHSIAFDSARGVLVLFGGNTGETDTWEWSPATGNWRLAAASGAGPSRRGGHAMAYDPVRARTVLTGGWYNTANAEVWEWNGVASTWTQRTGGAALPAARNTHAMVFDPQRQDVILYGGTSTLPDAVTTLAFDGVTWSTLPTPSNAGTRTLHGMAYDAPRNRTVLIPSGTGGGSTQVYELIPVAGGGQDWLLRSFTTTLPALREFPLLGYDPVGNVTLLAGGTSADTWTYDGTSWTRRVQNGFSRVRSSMAVDPATGRAYVFSGNFYASNNTCECDAFRQIHVWDGTAWTLAWSSGSINPRTLASAAYDEARGVTVLYGGRQLNPSNFSGVSPLSNTYEYNGVTWTLRNLALTPGRRCEAPMAYDAARGVMVLYGGLTGPSEDVGASATAAVWEYDGNAWVQRADGPGRRWRHSAVFDRARGTLVVFGGADENGAALADTWEYNGSAWTQRQVQGPPARSGAMMAYDSALNRTVLFGGNTGSAVLNDTWVWDGNTWTELPIPAAARPAARQMAGFAYDSDSRQMVLYAGRNASTGTGVNSTVWSLKGAQWTQQALATPIARAGAVFVYDSARRVFVLATGAATFNDDFATAQTWEASFPCAYVNCDNSTAAPVLNVNDFICFQTKFAQNDPYANCDGSTVAPVLNVNDFICFQQKFAVGCP